jgi:3-hydroxyacyl-CoA dehydrogenase
MPVKFEFENGVAVATIDNPPVNAIGREIREGLNGAMDRALEANAERLVITGAGSFFAAGADAREFDGPLREPHLNEVLHRLANFQIPTIAAINGPALGGGLEITLACRYRLCVETATLGLPEVTLGIVPGAGGTQRLPRLVGLGKAVDMIASGKALSAFEAVSIGLVD